MTFGDEPRDDGKRVAIFPKYVCMCHQVACGFVWQGQLGQRNCQTRVQQQRRSVQVQHDAPTRLNRPARSG